MFAKGKKGSTCIKKNASKNIINMAWGSRFNCKPLLAFNLIFSFLLLFPCKPHLLTYEKRLQCFLRFKIYTPIHMNDLEDERNYASNISIFRNTQETQISEAPAFYCLFGCTDCVCVLNVFNN